MPSKPAHTPSPAHSNETQDFHRAIVSLMEELDAIDWYTQRAELCTDASLRAILIHNKNEEVEHAMMLLEWLRRASPVFDFNAHKYMFLSGSISLAEITAKAEAAANTPTVPSAPPAPLPAAASARDAGSLGVGSLKGIAWTA